MALDYELQKFVSRNRLERLTTSIMTDFEFLKPCNAGEAFEIDPLSVQLVFRKLWEKAFYFTPLGTWITEVSLYLGYLMLFTYLSVNRFRVYDDPTPVECIFWVLNLGYVLYEVQMFFSNGAKQYYSEAQNYFDTLISIVFILSFSIRMYALRVGKPCEGYIENTEYPCYVEDNIHNMFIILWSIGTVTLWLRIINFFVLSHKLGPLVQMIFNMMGDVIRFFVIMGVLFFAFTMCLMYTMGDIYDAFDSPLNAGITLFRALLGDFDFDGFKDDDHTTDEALLFFGLLMMLIYLIIGSIVLLNLLIAIMAKTFDTIEETTRQSITFSKFKLAINRDSTASFMPPPYNVIAFGLFVLLFIIEWLIYIIQKIYFGCRRVKPSEQIMFDLAVFLMPNFLSHRQLELDEQVLFQECHMHFKITTNKGLSRCKFKSYEAATRHHEVQFEENVSMQNHVENKSIWTLDLFDLYRENLIDFRQFHVKTTSKYTQQAHTSMNSVTKKWCKKKCCGDSDGGEYKSPYWICANCRAYVKASEISVKKLGFLLNVHSAEMQIVNQRSPEICPNCYRTRSERKRWELICEIIAYWMFMLLVWWVLVLIAAFLLMILLLANPAKLTETFSQFKEKLLPYFNKPVVSNADQDMKIIETNAKTDSLPTDDLKKLDTNEAKTQYQNYVSYHYHDTQLISNLNEMDLENTMFDHKIPNEVWKILVTAKNRIDTLILRQQINKFIMKSCFEDELTQYEFYDDFIHKDSLVDENHNSWNNYFKPLSQTIFNEIKKTRNKQVPLHLFTAYPLDMILVEDDFQQFLQQKAEDEQIKHKSLNDLTKKDIVEALHTLKFLNCKNDKQRERIITYIKDDNSRSLEKNEQNTLYKKFTRYVNEIHSLFQDTRKIQNMLRDVHNAMLERGVDYTVLPDQINFMFEDIRDSVIALPFFNSMRTMEDNLQEQIIELWTIRNTLYSLYFLKKTIEEEVLNKHSRLYVTKKELLCNIFNVHKGRIIDPDGIIKAINNLDENEDVSSNTLVLTQKHDQQQRLKLFQKHEITAKDVTIEVLSIFHKIQKRRENTITETTIDYYRRKMPDEVRILQDDEALRYVFEQLWRVETFETETMNHKCDSKKLKELLLLEDDEKQYQLCMTFGHDQKYKIDKETIPDIITNEAIEELYKYLQMLYDETKNNCQDFDSKSDCMQVKDVLSLIMLFQRTFQTLNRKIVDSGDDFVVSHNIFCRFVDPDFNPDQPKLQWSKFTQSASHLFQNVLDEQQDFITLGQVRQTIDVLLNDIAAMQCGELTRIKNHLAKNAQYDKSRCYNNYKNWTQNINKVDAENPELNFKYIDENEWIYFIQKIAKNFRNNVTGDEFNENKSSYFSSPIRGNSSFDIIDETTHIKIDKKTAEEYDTKRRHAFNTILSFCGSRLTLQQLLQFSYIFKRSLEKYPKIRRLMRLYHKIYHCCGENTMIEPSLSELKTFCSKYGLLLTPAEKSKTPKPKNEYVELLKDTKIHSVMTEEKFKDIYFKTDELISFKEVKEDNDLTAEISWLYLCENEYDLCYRLYPFWSDSLKKDILNFMESSTQIHGNYELKENEFGQLKYSLNINYELALKLFRIIRFKIRTLSWEQINNYFQFVLN
eukprot:218973_1